MATRSTRRNGPAPIPNEVKRRRGNPGKKRLPSEGSLTVMPTSRTAPKPPRPLGPLGMDFWERTWDAGYVWMSPSSDIDMLLLACELLDERAALREEVLAEGDWRQRSALRAMDKQLIDIYSLLGFSPTDRTRLGVAEVRVEDDLEAFRRRHSS